MNAQNGINILIAEDNEISRELMDRVLKTQGYKTTPVADGGEAIEAIKTNDIDLALVDLNMEPKGGFDFIKHLLSNAINLPVIIITADDSSDVLTRASELGVTRVLQKPVEPERLLMVTHNVLKRFGHNLSILGSTVHETRYTPDDLMQRAIDLAERNAQSKKGGPFGAVVANRDGEILGEGTNGITSRVDPTAHAEVMAIRRASEKLGRAELSDCVLYCSSEPTMMGRALITSVGITQVYYGLAHVDVNNICEREKKDFVLTDFTQIREHDALKMFKRWQNLEEKLSN